MTQTNGDSVALNNTKLKTYVFKTNINCENSIRTLMLFFDQNPTIKSWSVDTAGILSVDTTDLTAQEIISIVEKAGFRSELLEKEDI